MATIQGPTEFIATPVSKSFPKPATVIVGQGTSNITVEVAPRSDAIAAAQPINTFGNGIDVWTFGANTISANLAALTELANFLEQEVPSLNKPVWAHNIAELVGALNNAVAKSNQLCNDTNTTLAKTPSS